MLKELLLIYSFSLAAALFKMPPQLTGRIVGGEKVDIKEFPYQLSLQFHGIHICGAAIISNHFAITAAHCTLGSSPYDLTVRAGSNYRGFGGTTIHILSIFQNPNYNAILFDGDISVLKFATPLRFSNKIASIDLPKEKEEIEDGAEAVVSGWGVEREGGGLPTHLRAVRLRIVSAAKCKEAYNENQITDSMVCAGVGGGKDSCQGDSGGPLVVEGKLVGVVSWGYGCALPSYPGVYAKVSALREFIKAKTEI